MAELARVCVMDSERVGSAYGRLERCKLEIAAVLPRFVELTSETMARFDVILIGCDERAMLAARFEESVTRMSALRPLVAIVPRPTERIAMQAARAGFTGLVARDVPPSALERTVVAVLRGELAFSRATLSALARAATRAQGGGIRLTARQRQCVELIAKGATDSEIGRVLGISGSTVHKHVLSALRRTSAKTRGQLVAEVGHSWLVSAGRGAG